MTSFLPLIVAGIVCAWALLTLVGGERTRRIDEMDAIDAAEARAAQMAKEALGKQVATVVAVKSGSPAATAAPKAAAGGKDKPDGKGKPDAKGKSGKGKSGK